MAVWIPALTYESVLLSGARSSGSLGQIATAGFFGAASGFLFAAMLTMRQSRREKVRARR
jgi:hypothetical protein